MSVPAGRLTQFDIDGTLFRPWSMLRRIPTDTVAAVFVAAAGCQKPFDYRGGERFHHEVNLADSPDVLPELSDGQAVESLLRLTGPRSPHHPRAEILTHPSGEN